ncbi:FecCD family ABC transporter permease [Parahaliea mediterranea]|uniref:Iron ABC transporter permease n=1 Tax=Parahaliea mediterranea TaxID=651086 RepID=A0A939DEU2_9GAMM|nr:iron chelate uptake ABC transporter family permease subunit [Parahaliea mediterranea]MBN7796222.1 iron ABC transporter permease [Parahaliea mediterranea]
MIAHAPVATRRVLWGLSLLLPVILVVAIGSGAVTLSPGEALGGVLAWWRGEFSQAGVIVAQIRLPRVLLAALIGAILASSGAAMQGLFRNPLADPSLIGVTAGASLGASIAIVAAGAGLQGLSGITVISLGAFAGGLLAVLLVYRLASSTAGTSVATMLLAGIAISALAGAVGNLLEFHADSEVLRRISLWRMGGLDGADPTRLAFAAAVCLVVAGSLPLFATPLNALLLGESEARYLGIDVERTKIALVVLVAVGVGASVALAGTIAFVGLVVPHIMRLLIGPDHRSLIPASALAGAILLVVADTLARVVMAPTELPVGIVTAIIGVPFFISLLRQRAQYGMR